jgi:hypothetical protein
VIEVRGNNKTNKVRISNKTLRQSIKFNFSGFLLVFFCDGDNHYDSGSDEC